MESFTLTLSCRSGGIAEVVSRRRQRDDRLAGRQRRSVYLFAMLVQKLTRDCRRHNPARPFEKPDANALLKAGHNTTEFRLAYSYLLGRCCKASVLHDTCEVGKMVGLNVIYVGHE